MWKLKRDYVLYVHMSKIYCKITRYLICFVYFEMKIVVYQYKKMTFEMVMLRDKELSFAML